MEQTYTFHIHGMHCKSCVLIINEEMNDLPHVTKAKADLDRRMLEVSGRFGDASPSEIAEALTESVKKHGYTISLERQIKKVRWSEFKIALPVAVVFSLLFVLLQKAGLVNLISGDTVTYGTAFVVGLIASLSTCMAVVGGLVLSMSASFAKEGDKTRPQILFHFGRLVAFFILGGVIGAIGSAFELNAAGTFILGIVIGVVMFIMGVNLLDVFPWAKKLQPALPKRISRHAITATKLNHTLTPVLVGIATFFLPCGFTQSMQIYTLSTGSFLAGALTMLSFALGTLPVLALLSFSSFSIQKSSRSGIFFKSAGLIVILFAMFNIINSLAVIGIIPPIFNF